jgi:spermidine synthase
MPISKLISYPSTYYKKITRTHFLLPTILILFFFSGASALVYEVVWMKMLTLVFGATAFAISTTLASFMAGLALGNYWFGRLVDRSHRPLLIYSLLEFGIGIFAFIMPVVFSLLDNIYIYIYQDITQNYIGLNLIRFVLSFIILIIPTTLMGGTLPVITRFLFRQSGHLGERVSQLYSVNTLGAVVGTFTTGFFLIAVLGIHEAAYLAGTINLLIAAVMLALDRKHSTKSRNDNQNTSNILGRSEDNQIFSSRLAKLALWSIGISGFCSLAYEVFWTRALIFILDNTSHAFATMLSAFLFGLALGSMIVARWVGSTKRLFITFGIIEVFIGFFALLSIPVFGNLGVSVGGASSYTETNQWLWVLTRFGRSFLMMLIPTVLMGMTIPIATSIYTKGKTGVGSAVGRVFAINTMGGVLGSIMAGFLLIPLIGISGSIMMVATINATIGIALILAEPVMKYCNRIRMVVANGALIVTTLAVLMFYGQLIFISPTERTTMNNVLYYEEGADATVKVYQDIFLDKTLSIDGFPVAGTTRRHQDGQKSLGNIPLLLSQVDQPSVNIIGFGAGGSSWAATLYDISSIECVELVPTVLEASSFFPEINHGVLDDPQLTIITGDGRNYLLLTDKIYDIISVDATSPKSAGSGNLYTEEFYQLCQKRLSQDGLMLQWLPFHLLSEVELKMTTRTFLQVFPHASLWFSFQRNYFLLVGTQQPLSLDFQKLVSLTLQEDIQKELGPLAINDAFDVLTCFIMDEEALSNYVNGARLNTDNHPYLEFEPSIGYFLIEEYIQKNISSIAPLRQSIWPYLVNVGRTESEIQTVHDELEKRIIDTSIDNYWPQYVSKD